MTMKRIIRQDGEIDTLTTANCFMLLSQLGFAATTLTGGSGRVFACKTCNREFPSFQALGGHRASHKKPRLAVRVQAQKSKRHECSICGIEFATGQALGGHTRRHRRRDVVDDDTRRESVEMEVEVEVAMMMKSSSSSKRVLCLDLNLTPYENHMKITKTSTDTITEIINF